ncbi:UNVERIFIED_CONTAM: hypothetical protein Sradi_2921300, partial [Sesamum radiatum]
MSTTLILPLCIKPLPKSLLLRHNSPPIIRRRGCSCRSTLPVKCQAVGEPTESTAVYRGVYGPWKIESSDVQEVILYRSGLVTAAVSLVAASSAAFLQNSDLEVFDLIRENLDFFMALWVIGAVGSLGTYATLAQPAGKSLVEYVVENPTAVWFVGPLFAALTGLVFKE